MVSSLPAPSISPLGRRVPLGFGGGEAGAEVGGLVVIFLDRGRVGSVHSDQFRILTLHPFHQRGDTFKHIPSCRSSFTPL